MDSLQDADEVPEGVGDETCRCMTGGQKHGPYAYRAYRDGDTVRREYLGKAESE